MAGSVNKVILIGKPGEGTPSRSMQNGSKVCTLDRHVGERKAATRAPGASEWHRDRIFNENLIRSPRISAEGSKVYSRASSKPRNGPVGEDKYSTRSSCALPLRS